MYFIFAMNICQCINIFASCLARMKVSFPLPYLSKGSEVFQPNFRMFILRCVQPLFGSITNIGHLTTHIHSTMTISNRRLWFGRISYFLHIHRPIVHFSGKILVLLNPFDTEELNENEAWKYIWAHDEERQKKSNSNMFNISYGALDIKRPI